MKNLFKNTKELIKFILKIEKIRIPIYILSIVGFLVALLPIFDNILKTSNDMNVLIETMRNPAMVSLVGPVYVTDAYTTGSMYANYMTIFTAIMFAIWNILFVNNHTRKQEESDKLEMLRSLPIGKLSNIASTLVVAFFVNAIICLLLIAGFYAFAPSGMQIKSIINFSVSTTLVGFLFAVLTGLFAQISSSSTTNNLSFMSLLVFYFIRAIGDVTNESFSLISPLGILSRTKSFIDDYYWPIAILAIVVVSLILLTYSLAKNRDLNSGIINERKGKSKLNPLVNSIGSFTLKILMPQIIIWSIVIFSFSAMYGSVLGDLEGYINSSDMIKQMLKFMPNFSLTEQFVSLLMVIMSMISTIPVLIFTNKIISDEKNALSEEILTKPVSKYKYFASYIIISVIMAFILQILTSLGFWYIGKMFLDEIPNLQTFIISSLNYIPAILVNLGLAILLIGIFPKHHWLSYLYLGYSFFTVYFGRLMDIPEFVEKTSPFGIIPTYPLEDLNYGISAILMGIFVLFTFIGMVSYRKRDLIN